MAENLINIPPSPTGKVDPDLEERCKNFLAGKTSRDYSNPYVVERVMKVLEIDEYASNFGSAAYNPLSFLDVQDAA